MREEIVLFAFLDTFLHVPWMLAGLAFLTIPLIIHLLNRRRFDVVDWGAMQFLQVSEVVRRRMMLEEILLMLLRMSILAVLVFALAGPFLSFPLPKAWRSRPVRDVVLLLDASASMSALDELGGATPLQKARDWLRAYLDELSPQDQVALLLVRDQIQPLVTPLSSDRDRIRDQLERLAEPAGSANWPEAIKQAYTLLEKSQKSRRDIIIFTDNQKFGWADADSLFRWDLLAHELDLTNNQTSRTARPQIWVVNLASDRDRPPPNYGLAPLNSNRPVVPVEREVTFRSEILLSGVEHYSPPYKIRLEVDGKPIRDLLPPGGQAASLPVPKEGRLPFSFTHRFARPGCHLVSVILEPDPPPEDRPPNYALRDGVPGDNRQDYALEVLSVLPVLIVDGGSSAAASPTARSDFIRDALSPARDRTPSVQAKVVSVDEFRPELLTTEPRPRVLILHDVPRLRPVETEAVTGFVASGGGVLVTLGERADKQWYNDQLYREGQGWLPARLDGIAGEETQPQLGVRPDPTSFTHPVLELFARVAAGGLADAQFARWWKLTTPGRHAPGVPVGLLQTATARYPFLMERSYQAGRVLVCAEPLDNSWGTNLIDLPAFVPLLHEAVYYLAGARGTEFNLRPGQPIRLRVTSGELEEYRLKPPGGPERPFSSRPENSETYFGQLLQQEQGAMLVYEGARAPGVYRVLTPQLQSFYFVVPTDPRESDLTPCSVQERELLTQKLGITFEEDREVVLDSIEEESPKQDLWMYLLLALIGLLCLEVWMTRRLVMKR